MEKFKGTEADLCVAFMEQFNSINGWTCYPETAGFDILVVHEDGRQIGVEAKLKLNSKVADQILPDSWEIRNGNPGPDHRMVIVGDLTDSSLGIAKMLAALGVLVLCPHMGHRYLGAGRLESFPDFQLSSKLMHRGSGYFGDPHLCDWNPTERCAVPCVVPDVPAGVPSPLRLTPWKESAIKVMIILRRQGYITAKQITEQGISPSVWTQGPKAWLEKGLKQGHWIETDRLPSFDKQHPDAFAKITSMMEAE